METQHRCQCEPTDLINIFFIDINAGLFLDPIELKIAPKDIHYMIVRAFSFTLLLLFRLFFLCSTLHKRIELKLQILIIQQNHEFVAWYSQTNWTFLHKIFSFYIRIKEITIVFRILICVKLINIYSYKCRIINNRLIVSDCAWFWLRPKLEERYLRNETHKE